MPKRKEQLKNYEKIGWQLICPTCVKYELPNHLPDCGLCRRHGVTEYVLCKLTRMDQEECSEDFRCDAYEPKQPLQ